MQYEQVEPGIHPSLLSLRSKHVHYEHRLIRRTSKFRLTRATHYVRDTQKTCCHEHRYLHEALYRHLFLTYRQQVQEYRDNQTLSTLTISATTPPKEHTSHTLRVAEQSCCPHWSKIHPTAMLVRRSLGPGSGHVGCSSSLQTSYTIVGLVGDTTTTLAKPRCTPPPIVKRLTLNTTLSPLGRYAETS